MLPSLKPGQIVIAICTNKLRVGDIVIMDHNRLEKIKRVTGLKDNTMYVTGDNPANSTDSRNFGWLPIPDGIARVVYPRRLHKGKHNE